ncbi:MAG: GMP/IMP nucleotidase [Gammaproteobacteria bacterium]|nr:GMP/IMP nucleotidase [Gammaproteobacteria bacterium]
MVDWDRIDTVLLDMDGTLLDLHYDNTLWNHLLPARYGKARNLSLETARSVLFEHMALIRGQMTFYCLDHWAEFTGLDIVSLHHELTELISYRPHAEAFLHWLQIHGKRAVLVTNAHRGSLQVKNAHSDITAKLNADVSAHDYGIPKEAAGFWARLIDEEPYDPEKTLLIDDNDSVLNAAREFGIGHLLTVTQPDSNRPPRESENFPTFNAFHEILPDG